MKKAKYDLIFVSMMKNYLDKISFQFNFFFILLLLFNDKYLETIKTVRYQLQLLKIN